MSHSSNPVNLLGLLFLYYIVRRLMRTKLMDIGGARHANNAREEMTRLNEELLAMAGEMNIETPVMHELHRYSGPAFSSRKT